MYTTGEWRAAVSTRSSDRQFPCTVGDGGQDSCLTWFSDRQFPCTVWDGFHIGTLTELYGRIYFVKPISYDSAGILFISSIIYLNRALEVQFPGLILFSIIIIHVLLGSLKGTALQKKKILRKFKRCST